MKFLFTANSEIECRQFFVFFEFIFFQNFFILGGGSGGLPRGGRKDRSLLRHQRGATRLRLRIRLRLKLRM